MTLLSLVHHLKQTSKIAILVLLMSQYVIYSSSKETKTNDDLSWWHEAEEMLVHLTKLFANFVGQPCDDFYGYVCKSNFSRTDVTEPSNDNIDIDQTERKIFKKFINNDEQPLMGSELKLKLFYQACYRTRTAKELKESKLYRMVGGWPAIRNDVVTSKQTTQQSLNINKTWIEIVTSFHSIGTDYFFKYRIGIKSNRRLLELLPNTSQRYTLRKYEQLVEVVLAEHKVKAGRAHLIGLEMANFERDRRKSLQISNNVTNASASIDKYMEISYQEFKDKIFSQNSDINWDHYFRQVLGKPPKETDIVRVHGIEQLRNIFDLLSNTSINCLLNYLWIEYLMGKGKDDCQALSKEYFNSVYWHIIERSSTTKGKSEIAKMFAAIGDAYEILKLPSTPWIDEMTNENSKQFLGRIIHSTLNAITKLDTEYVKLNISKENFYQNLENCHQFLLEKRIYHSSTTETIEAHHASIFARVYLRALSFLKVQNLTVPLDYPIVGEYFAELMIGGGRSDPLGSWRSTDSDQEFIGFQQCLQKQNTSLHYSTANSLLLKILAQKMTFSAFSDWQNNNREFVKFIESKIPLALNKTYFIASVVRTCNELETSKQSDFINTYLQNSRDFIETFQCQQSNKLYVKNICTVL